MSDKHEANISDLFLFERPSSSTPEQLLERLGEQGLSDLQSDISGGLRDAETEYDIIRIQMDTVQTTLQALRADQSVVAQAQQLARDRGLE